jgi:hypothetical protein
MNLVMNKVLEFSKSVRLEEDKTKESRRAVDFD